MNRRGFLITTVPFAAAMRAMCQEDAQFPVVPVGGKSMGKTVTVGVHLHRHVTIIENRSGKTVEVSAYEYRSIDPLNKTPIDK